jgi:hypothetical protein
MAPLSAETPSSDKMYVSYDFENIQDTPFSDTVTAHLPNLVCLAVLCGVKVNLI